MNVRDCPFSPSRCKRPTIRIPVSGEAHHRCEVEYLKKDIELRRRVPNWIRAPADLIRRRPRPATATPVSAMRNQNCAEKWFSIANRIPWGPASSWERDRLTHVYY